MRYRLGVKIAVGIAVTVSAWAGRGADLDGAVLSAKPAVAKPAVAKPAVIETAAFDLGLATVYRRHKAVTPAPIWELRALPDDDGNLATVEASVEITPADRAPIFGPQRLGLTPRR